jgi:hypothetical protein
MDVRAAVGEEGRGREQPSPVLGLLHLACVRIPIKTHTTFVVRYPMMPPSPSLRGGQIQTPLRSAYLVLPFSSDPLNLGEPDRR